MNLTKSQNFTLIWLILVIPLLSYFLLKKTFNLALYGDDWLQLYNLWLSFDIHKTLSFFDIKSYLGAYMPQYFFLGIIRYFFGYEAQAYFAISLLLRILSAISLFFLVKEVTKDRVSSLIATILFTFSVTGLQTTDWVFNMNTYAGIFFLNFALVIYLKIRQLTTFFSWYYLTFILLFTLALGVVPVRMHGAVPFVIAAELFLYILFEKKNILKFDKFLIFRILLPIAIMFMLVKVGSYGSEGDILPQLQTSFIYLQDMVNKGKYDIFFYFFGIMGNLVIPDTLNIGAKFIPLVVRFILFTLFGFLISFAVGGNKFAYISIIILNIFWALISKFLLIWNPDLSMGNLFSISLGFQFVILLLITYNLSHKKYPKLANLIVVGFFWIILFSLLYWLRTPYLIIESTGRYMTMGAIGFSILLAGIISIMLHNFKNTHRIKSLFLIIPSILLIILLGLNFIATQIYLNNLVANRNLNLAKKTWDSLKKEVPYLDEKSPSVFYFTYDNSTAANMVLIFGFWPHAGLEYKITNWENTPLPTEDYKELLAMVKNGEILKTLHARKPAPVPLSRVFSFNLKNGELISTTKSIREQLSKDIKENAK